MFKIEKFEGKVEHLINYFSFLANHLREIMAELGIRTVNELVGRTDLLEIRNKDAHWKTKNLNLEALLYQFEKGRNSTLYCSTKQDHGIENTLDRKLIKETQLSRNNNHQTNKIYPIKSTNRSVGTMLSYEISKKYGSNGMDDNSINIRFRGSAGQSFGAFAAKGIKFTLEGEANDYVGKGLCGAKLIIIPDRHSKYKPEENIIVGNVTLYGATSGEIYIKGMAGDRFGVRNSGAHAVVEGIGDNGCEYMTGGSVIILGSIGRNFAAGMSGGFAYILDGQQEIKSKINHEMIFVEKLTEDDEQFVKKQIRKHFLLTGSTNALDILNNWDDNNSRFIKIYPKELKAIYQKNNTIRAQA